MNSFVVLIYNPDDKWAEMVDYIIDNNIEMINYEIIDVSNYSELDEIASFRFENEQDAVYFKLRFNNGKCY